MEYTAMTKAEQVRIVQDRIRTIEAQHFSVTLNITEVEAARSTYSDPEYDQTISELVRSIQRYEMQAARLHELLATAEPEQEPDPGPEPDESTFEPPEEG